MRKVWYNKFMAGNKRQSTGREGGSRREFLLSLAGAAAQGQVPGKEEFNWRNLRQEKSLRRILEAEESYKLEAVLAGVEEALAGYAQTLARCREYQETISSNDFKELYKFLAPRYLVRQPAGELAGQWVGCVEFLDDLRANNILAYFEDPKGLDERLASADDEIRQIRAKAAALAPETAEREGIDIITSVGRVGTFLDILHRKVFLPLRLILDKEHLRQNFINRKLGIVKIGVFERDKRGELAAYLDGVYPRGTLRNTVIQPSFDGAKEDEFTEVGKGCFVRNNLFQGEKRIIVLPDLRIGDTRHSLDRILSSFVNWDEMEFMALPEKAEWLREATIAFENAGRMRNELYDKDIPKIGEEENWSKQMVLARQVASYWGLVMYYYFHYGPKHLAKNCPSESDLAKKWIGEIERQAVGLPFEIK